MTVAGGVFLMNAVTTFVLTGVIWTVQLVHYPAFRYVEASRFAEFETFHRRRISYIVVPLMLAELASTLLLLWERPEFFSTGAAWAGLAALVVIWASTFFLQVPLHARLAGGYCPDSCQRLTATNGIRTAAWTLRGAILAWAMSGAIVGAQI